jgi:two-component sensor histidine kinase
MTIATVQQQLDPIVHGEMISVGTYLTALCKSLARTMIGGKKPITIEVKATSGSVTSDVAVSFGLLTTELVINALKHAFTDGRTGTVTVTYDAHGSDWSLSVGDDGVGMNIDKKNERTGLGTSIIGALANQLQAIIRKESSAAGTTVSISHTEI